MRACLLIKLYVYLLLWLIGSDQCVSLNFVSFPHFNQSFSFLCSERRVGRMAGLVAMHLAHARHQVRQGQTEADPPVQVGCLLALS